MPAVQATTQVSMPTRRQLRTSIPAMMARITGTLNPQNCIGR